MYRIPNHRIILQEQTPKYDVYKSAFQKYDNEESLKYIQAAPHRVFED